MYFLILFFCMLCMVGGCSPEKASISAEKPKSDPSHEIIYDLNATTNGVMALIAQKKLHTVMEEISQKELEKFLKNMSPAHIALELEGLSGEEPIVLFYFHEKDDTYQSIRKKLIDVLGVYKNIKCLEIDDRELFSLSNDADIDVFPAVLVVCHKQEIARFEGNEVRNKIENEMALILASINGK